MSGDGTVWMLLGARDADPDVRVGVTTNLNNRVFSRPLTRNELDQMIVHLQTARRVAFGEPSISGAELAAVGDLEESMSELRLAITGLYDTLTELVAEDGNDSDIDDVDEADAELEDVDVADEADEAGSPVDDVVFCCDECEYTSPRRQALAAHFRARHAPPVACPACGGLFQPGAPLGRHMSTCEAGALAAAEAAVDDPAEDDRDPAPVSEPAVPTVGAGGVRSCRLLRAGVRVGMRRCGMTRRISRSRVGCVSSGWIAAASVSRRRGCPRERGRGRGGSWGVRRAG